MRARDKVGDGMHPGAVKTFAASGGDASTALPGPRANRCALGGQQSANRSNWQSHRGRARLADFICL